MKIQGTASVKTEHEDTNGDAAKDWLRQSDLALPQSGLYVVGDVLVKTNGDAATGRYDVHDIQTVDLVTNVNVGAVCFALLMAVGAVLCFTMSENLWVQFLAGPLFALVTLVTLAVFSREHVMALKMRHGKADFTLSEPEGDCQIFCASLRHHIEQLKDSRR